MTLEAVAALAPDTWSTHADEQSMLVPQAGRPSLPIQVPVVADCGGVFIRAEVIGSTSSVLLLQGSGAPLPAIGTPIRMRLEWDRQVLYGRLAAHGVAGRFLVSMGERGIRRSRRFSVDLPGIASSTHLHAPTEVRITDLSTGGARVAGLSLPVGSEVNLRFTPPGRSIPLNVLAFVVRTIDPAVVPAVGVAFRLAQPSMDVLVDASQSPG